MHLAATGNRPDEAAPLQAFGEEAQSVTVSPQHFYLVTPASAEDEQMPGERVILIREPAGKDIISGCSLLFRG